MKAIRVSKYSMLLAVLILAQLLYTTYVFAFWRQGAHSDEMWCYGFSNSYYRPYLNSEDNTWVTDIQVENYTNCNEWVPGRVFRDYLTVQPGERFAYGSVYYNMSSDSHPPLYSMLLHTVSSFFVGEFSFYHAFWLNCILLVGTQIYLYLLARRLTGSEAAALLTCLFYGGGIGALSTFLYLRQYSLLTMLVTAYTYYGISFLKAEGKAVKYWIGAVLTAFLGFMTHYYAIAYVGMLTAFLCLCMLWHKQIRRMLGYGLGILAALGSMVLAYPPFWTLLFASDNPEISKPAIPINIKVLLNDWLVSCVGLRIRIYQTMFWKRFGDAMIVLLVIVGIVCFLCRKEAWLHRAWTRLKEGGRLWARIIKEADKTVALILLSALVMFVFAGSTVNILRRGTQAGRFVFFVFPAMSCVIITILYGFLQKLRRLSRYRIGILLAVVVLVLTKVQLTAPCYYLFQHYGAYQDMAELVKEKNVLVVSLSQEAMHWMLPSCSPYLYTAGNVFFTSVDAMEEDVQKILAQGERVDYVLIRGNDFKMRQEEEDLVKTWSDLEEASLESMVMLSGLGQVNDEQQKETQTKWIRSLNGGCDYQILFGICIQDFPLYVLELSQNE